MRNFEEIKRFIASIEDADFAVPVGIDMDTTIADMLKHIGTTDSNLREGIYSTFAEWEDNGIFSHEQLRHILTVALDNEHLFLGLGESGTDTVFTRAFSSLVICAVLSQFEDDPYLSEAEISAVKDKILRYVREEKDFRGYVEGRGWAHAIAHAADMLNNIAYCVGREGILHVLDAVAQAVSNGHLVYTALEDERLADASISCIHTAIVEHGIIEAEVFCGWLKNVGKMVKREVMPRDYNINANRKAFIKSIYAKLVIDTDFDGHKDAHDKICECLLEIIREIYED
ncbi:MAG: DUF2785 domain-containing protein [Defluviitaleaceae bacterium]|nr:DUF2785 domain-containing protein [Defluviitaleaceae bacterium]